MYIFNIFKLKVFKVVEKGPREERAGSVFDFFIVTLIVLNVAAIILESFDEVYTRYGAVFDIFELFSVMVFTLEYAMRVWTADLKFDSSNRLYSRLRFIKSTMAVIDLLAILPFYLGLLFIPVDVNLVFLRMLRLTRLLRVFKLSRYTSAMKLMSKVIKEKKDELSVTVFMTFILLLIASTMMYYIEKDVHGDAFPNIVAAFWWAIATLTTVGYGDVYPVTGLGKLLSGIIALLGIGLVALPTGIISSSFIEELSKSKSAETADQAPQYCPHCGRKLNE